MRGVVGKPPRPYDLLWPIARRRQQAIAGLTEEVKQDKGAVKAGGALVNYDRSINPLIPLV